MKLMFYFTDALSVENFKTEDLESLRESSIQISKILETDILLIENV